MWLPDKSGVIGMRPAYLGDTEVMGCGLSLALSNPIRTRDSQCPRRPVHHSTPDISPEVMSKPSIVKFWEGPMNYYLETGQKLAKS